jgi:hypothetical protein
LASNGRFFLSVNDAALAWIKGKFRKDLIYFRQIFGAIEPMLHKKPFLKNRNENDVTVSIFICNENDVTVKLFKKTNNGNDVTVSIFR